ncbi:MAG: otopetrin domain-containing protein [Clostridia bacterium]|nr:otopetrin domain-containing protein [Clostridia bacterium]
MLILASIAFIAMAAAGMILNIRIMTTIAFLLLVAIWIAIPACSQALKVKKSKEQRSKQMSDRTSANEPSTGDRGAYIGLNHGVSVRVSNSKRTYSAQGYSKNSNNSKAQTLLKLFFFVAVVICIILFIVFLQMDKTMPAVICFACGIVLIIVFALALVATQRKSSTRAQDNVESAQSSGASEYQETLGTVVDCIVSNADTDNVFNQASATTYKVIIDVNHEHKTAYSTTYYSQGTTLKVITQPGAKWASLLDEAIDGEEVDVVSPVADSASKYNTAAASNYRFKLTINDNDNENTIFNPISRDLVDAVNILAKSETNFLVLESSSPIDGIIVIQANGCSPNGDYVWVEAIYDNGADKDSTIYSSEVDAKTLVNMLNDFTRYRTPDTSDWTLFS